LVTVVSVYCDSVTAPPVDLASLVYGLFLVMQPRKSPGI